MSKEHSPEAVFEQPGIRKGKKYKQVSGARGSVWGMGWHGRCWGYSTALVLINDN